MRVVKELFGKSSFYLAVICVCAVLLIIISLLSMNAAAEEKEYFPPVRSQVIELHGVRVIQFSIYNHKTNQSFEGLIPSGDSGLEVEK